MVLCYLLLLHLTINGQLFLTFIQLRSDILNEDSTDRVLLSKSNSLKTFNAVIKLLNRFLGNTLLHWLPDKSIIENRPMVVKDVFLPKNTILNWLHHKILFDRMYDKPYSLIWGSLEWLFSELFLSNASLRDQYKFIVFNIFSSNILIIYCKILIITVTSNETANESTIYANYVETSQYFS